MAFIYHMDCLKSQKGGVTSRETAATKEDLEDLDRLKLGSKVNDSRSESKGRLLHVMVVIKVWKTGRMRAMHQRLGSQGVSDRRHLH